MMVLVINGTFKQAASNTYEVASCLVYGRLKALMKE